MLLAFVYLSSISGLSMLRIPASLLVALLILTGSGCAPWRNGDSTNYQTIHAEPNRDTKRARDLNDRALKGMALGKMEKVESLLTEALVADVEFGPAHNNLGKLYFDQHKLYLAAWEFEFAAGLMPERAEPLNNLGMVYEAAGRLDQAVEAYERAHALAQQDAEVLGNLIRARMMRGDSGPEIDMLLQSLIFVDSRADWVHWAHERLAFSESMSSGGEPARRRPEEIDPSNVKSNLPLPVPPQPEVNQPPPDVPRIQLPVPLPPQEPLSKSYQQTP